MCSNKVEIVYQFFSWHYLFLFEPFWFHCNFHKLTNEEQNLNIFLRSNRVCFLIKTSLNSIQSQVGDNSLLKSQFQKLIHSFYLNIRKNALAVNDIIYLQPRFLSAWQFWRKNYNALYLWALIGINPYLLASLIHMIYSDKRNSSHILH